MGGEDESSSQGMWYAVAGAKALQKAIGGLVILVHHTGKDAARGMRGHSSLNARAGRGHRGRAPRRVPLVAAGQVPRSEDNISGAFTLQRIELPPYHEGRPLPQAVQS